MQELGHRYKVMEKDECCYNGWGNPENEELLILKK
jgi:hypothetical protein